jgi:hypothetical protein
LDEGEDTMKSMDQDLVRSGNFLWQQLKIICNYLPGIIFLGILFSVQPVLSNSRQPSGQGGNGSFTIKVKRERGTPRAGTGAADYFKFTQIATGRIVFEPYDINTFGGNFKCKVTVSVQEKVIRQDWKSDQVTTRSGQQTVDCFLYYPWGEEGAGYGFNLDAVRTTGNYQEKNYYDNTSDSRTLTGTTSVQSAVMSGKPKRFATLIEGSFVGKSGGNNISAQWQFDLEPQPPVADAGGPYTAQRGQSITLDGSGSEGNISSYTWRFAPGDDCKEAGTSSANKRGESTSVTLLCSTKITLTVNNGIAEDSDEAQASVSPRTWKTAFEHVDQVGVMVDAVTPVAVRGHPAASAYVGGENVCAICGAGSDYHNFHPAAQDGSWADHGYIVEEVNDPDGPFDRFWYASQYRLQIKRQSLINPYLLPGGRPPVSGAMGFYHANKNGTGTAACPHGGDIDGYLAAIKAHEFDHSARKERALGIHDPAKEIERTFAKTRKELLEQLDKTIQEAERSVCDASKDPLPRIWQGSLCFPYDDSGLYDVNSPVEIGGPNYLDHPSCN